MRKPLALLCLAVILLAAVTPLSPAIVCAVFVAIALLAPHAPVVARRADDRGCDEQPVALLALVSFRAPPAIRF